MSILASLAMTAATLQITDFRGAVRGGDVHAIWADPATGLIALGEGDCIALIEHTPGASCTMPVTELTNTVKLPIDATPMAITGRGAYLYVAGGSQGLIGISQVYHPLVPSALSYTVLDDSQTWTITSQPTGQGNNEKWCWDVTMAKTESTSGPKYHVVALFSARQSHPNAGGSEVRVYAEQTGVIEAVIPVTLPGAAGSGCTTPNANDLAFGYALATRPRPGGQYTGDRVLVAMGTGGLVEIDLAPLAQSTPGAPTSNPVGYLPPGFPASTPGCSIPTRIPSLPFPALVNAVPPAIANPPATTTYPDFTVVRDVEVASDGSVFLAADDMGVLELQEVSGALTVVQMTPCAILGGTGAYAHRVSIVDVPAGALVDQYLFVSARSQCAEADFEAPFVPWGRFGPHVETGGGASVGGSVWSCNEGYDALLVFAKPAGASTFLPAAQKVQVDGARNNGGNLVTLPLAGSPGGPSIELLLQPYGFAGGCNQQSTQGIESVVGLDILQLGGLSALPLSIGTTCHSGYYHGTGFGVLTVSESLITDNTYLQLGEGGSGAVGDEEYRFVDASNPTNPQPLHVRNTAGLLSSALPQHAQWPDTSSSPPSAEWFMTAHDQAHFSENGFRLNRLDWSANPPRFQQWLLRSPRLDDCYRPRNYHQSRYFVDAASGGRERILSTVLSSAYVTLNSAGQILNTHAPAAIGGITYDAQFLTDRASMVQEGTALFPSSDPAQTAGTLCWEQYPGPGSAYQRYCFDELVEVHPEVLNASSWAAYAAHDEYGQTVVFNGETEVIDDGNGTSYAVIAAGSWADDSQPTTQPHWDGQATDPNFGAPMITIVDLSTPPSAGSTVTPCSSCNTPAPPRRTPAHVVQAPLPIGLAVGVKVVSLECPGTNQVRRFAFVADWGGRLLVFDVTHPDATAGTPAAPVFVHEVVFPRDVVDNYIDNVAHVAVDTDTLCSGYIFVYVSILRIGIVRLRVNVGDLSVADPFVFPGTTSGNHTTLGWWNIPNVKKIDTPGLAHDFLLRKGSLGQKGLVLADKLGGLRFYGDF